MFKSLKSVTWDFLSLDFIQFLLALENQILSCFLPQLNLLKYKAAFFFLKKTSVLVVRLTSGNLM